MSNEEKAKEININITPGCYSAYKGALEMAEWKDQQFRAEAEHFIDTMLDDYIYDIIMQYKELEGALNDDGTLRSDYQLAQDISMDLEYKIIDKLFKKIID